jgi:hypothetical protein
MGRGGVPLRCRLGERLNEWGKVGSSIAEKYSIRGRVVAQIGFGCALMAIVRLEDFRLRAALTALSSPGGITHMRHYRTHVKKRIVNIQ